MIIRNASQQKRLVTVITAFPRRALSRNVHTDLTTINIFSVHLLDGRVSLIGGRECDEAEATGATGLTVTEDNGISDLAE